MNKKYHEIHLEITTHCNFHCGFCPHSKLSRKKQHMPLDQACEALCQIADGNISDKVTYHLMGEPLLHPNIGEILAYAHEKKLENRVVTNGFVLRNKNIQDMLRHCDVLDISLRATDRESFRSIAPVDDFKTYLKHLKFFLKQSENSTSHIRLRMFHGEHVVLILNQLGFEPSSSIEQSADKRRKTISLTNKITLMLEPCQKWIAYDERFPCRFGQCSEFETGFSILVNGDMTTCCWDYEGRNVFGNFITDGGIVGCLTNSKAKQMRDQFRRNVMPTSFCKKCMGRSSHWKALLYQSHILLKTLKAKF